MPALSSRSFSQRLLRGLWLLFVVMLLGTGTGPAYSAQPGVPGNTNVNVQWNQSLILLDYQVDPSSNGKTLINGNQPLTVTLYWQTTQKLAVDYTIWVHLVATGNRTVNQADSQPVGGTYPTSAWTPGETVVDKHVLLVPYEAAPGSYSVAVGLYRTTAGDRVPLALGSGGTFNDRYVLPHSITVLPPATPTPIP
jgi:hypothetical protein